MTEKEEQVLNIINTFYMENKLMPSIRYLQKKLDYKSSNSISQYLKSLESKGYLKRNKENKLILSIINDNNQNMKTIKIINSKETVSLLLDKKDNYIGFKIKNNYFVLDNIKKDDILIIKKTNVIKNNDLALFIINQKYRIMKYFYKDGFYILKDKEEIILNKVKLIGKVIMIERKL